MSVEGTPRPLNFDVRDEAYRLVREALLNAFRHAHANLVEVVVRYDATGLHVRVHDDGIGIDPQVEQAGARPGHWGLPGMRERAVKMGARVDIFSRPGAGSNIELSVPATRAFVRGFRGFHWPFR